MKTSFPPHGTPNPDYTSTKQKRRADRIIQRSRVRATLRKIVGSLTRDLNILEDLLQDALLFLWKQLQRRPGQRWSWYLRGCRFRVMDLLQSGRSLDAFKRRSMALEIVGNGFEDAEAQDAQSETVQTQDSPRSSVCARDTLRRLWPRITSIQKTVLLDLFCGLSSRETAKAIAPISPNDHLPSETDREDRTGRRHFSVVQRIMPSLTE